MKKFTLVLPALFLLSCISNAQINKGSILVGGNIQFSSGKSKIDNNPDDNLKQSGFAIQPSFGIAFRKNLVIGIELGYGQNTVKRNEQETKLTDYNAGIFMRKYLPIANRVALFGEGKIYYEEQRGKDKMSFVTTKSIKVTSAGLSFIPGIAVSATKNFQLEISLGNLLAINYSKEEDNYGPYILSSESFNISTIASSSVPLNVGFRFLFGNK